MEVQESSLSLPGSKTRVVKKELGREDFLSLLMTQLKNQDPLKPQDNEQFIATMAQFNLLESMAEMVRSSEYSHAASMLGRMISIGAGPGQNPDWGLVERVGLVDGKVKVYVNSKEYDYSDVREIYADSRYCVESELLQAAQLIGREVVVQAQDGSAGGIVERVARDGSGIIVYVAGTPYSLSSVEEVGIQPAAAINVNMGVSSQ